MKNGNILCFDIGGTNFRYGIWDVNNGNFINVNSESTPKNVDAFFEKINKVIQDSNVSMVGIGFPGNVNKSGEVLFSPNLPFLENFNLLDFIDENIELKVENDANCAVLAAYKEYKNYQDIVSVTLGTGIGGSIMLNGKLLKNSRNIGFELGHIVVREDGAKCGCGKNGCVEAYSSSTGMIKRFGKNVRNFRELFEKAEIGNDIANKVIEEGFYYLGVFASILDNIFAPELFVFSGGVSKVMEIYLEHFYKGFYKNVLDFIGEKVIIKINTDENFGLLGVAQLFA